MIASRSFRIDFRTHSRPAVTRSFRFYLAIIIISAQFHIPWVVLAPISVPNVTRRIFPRVSAIRLGTRLFRNMRYPDFAHAQSGGRTWTLGWWIGVRSGNIPDLSHGWAELPWVRISDARWRPAVGGKVCVYGLCMGFGVHTALLNLHPVSGSFEDGLKLCRMYES